MNDPLAAQSLTLDPVAPAVTPAIAPATAPTQPAADDASPLDVLEQLLKSAQSKKAPQSMPDTATAAPPGLGTPAAAQPAIDPVVDQAEAQADYERIKAEHDVADQQKLEEQKRIMENLVHTPQYQARIEQDEQKKTEQQERVQDQDGYQIEQLVHTKL